MTVIILEERSLPVVSVQMLYKSGARDESAGKTGLAHFVEHLAFRGSASFPDAAATRAIYDGGGEWHGYTWIDQTTFYATMPRDGLDLLLRIEANRMAGVTIDAAGVEAEKGAVLTELHSYQDDPQSVLFDAIAAAALHAHPYRNNTIGYESDVAALTPADARDFYRRHYLPGNAVLAIVGDIDAAGTMAAVRKHFGSLPAGAPPRRSGAVEPPQTGERRTRITGPVDRRYFKLAHPAPAASNPDFAAFLVLQQLAAGGAGVNFDQNDWGTPAMPGTRLHGAAADLTSWFIPTADPYLFMISGSIAPDANEKALEAELDRRLAVLRAELPSLARLAAAKKAVLRQLAFDVESTEDAAHVLAFFEGLGAYRTLLTLADQVGATAAGDVQRVAHAYLDPGRRTIAWYVPGEAATALQLGAGHARSAAARPVTPSAGVKLPAPVIARTRGGVPVIVQQSSLSPTAVFKLVLSGPAEAGDPDSPLLGHSMLSRSMLGSEVAAGMTELAEALNSVRAGEPEPPSDRPEVRMEQAFARRIGSPRIARPAPLLIVASGNLDPAAVLPMLDGLVGGAVPAPQRAEPPARSPLTPAGRQVAVQTERIDKPLSQARIGYIVQAPAPGTQDGLAWRMLLYVLAHGYEGRLGRVAIGERGLVYRLSTDYRSDGRSGWITLSSGVDPEKIDAMEALLRAEILRLARDPPSRQELDAARQHLLGRDLSEAQTNAEIAGKLARQWMQFGRLPSHADLRRALANVTGADLARAARHFAAGTIIRVEAVPTRRSKDAK
ncbi:MAG TPA: insulinase family protein [Allosphingosinicella sp.]|nr:insulinase family protein [Allosphingosinicella sp.]